MDDKPHSDLFENVGGKSDPLDMTERLYKYSSKLLVRLEREDDQNDIKASITCLKYLNDTVKQYVDLRKKTTDDDESKSGSAVRKYAKAFAKNAAGGGKKGARRTAAAERDGDDGDEASE